jgi:5-aminolevulinate synthase
MIKNINNLKIRLKNKCIPFIQNESHIIPVIIGDPKLCKKASELLLDDFGIYVQPINYPTVPRGTERLRITASPLHTGKMIKELANALDEVFKTLKIKIAA